MPTRFMIKGGVEADDCVHGLPGVDEIYSGDQRLSMGKKVVFGDVNAEEEKGFGKNTGFKVKTEGRSCSDESSSIGKNSDLSENSVEKSGDDEEEVQSSYKGPLDAMEALEEVLPIRKGISRFYNGKSKSFASLADASASSSIKDIAKPDNAYMKRRRTLLACSLAWDKTKGPSLRGSHGGGIAKRVTGSSRTTLALAVAMHNSDCNKQAGEHNSSNGSLSMCSNFPPWRSFSLADLHQCASVPIACSSPNEFATKPA